MIWFRVPSSPPETELTKTRMVRAFMVVIAVAQLSERCERESFGARRVVKAFIKRGKQNALAGFAL